MNKRDLNLLRLGRENPKALDLLLRVSELLEVQSPAAISQEDLSRDLGLSGKTINLLLENLKDLVHCSRAGDLLIFSSKDIAWKEEGEYEVLKVFIVRKKSEAAGSEGKEEKPAQSQNSAAPSEKAPAPARK